MSRDLYEGIVSVVGFAEYVGHRKGFLDETHVLGNTHTTPSVRPRRDKREIPKLSRRGGDGGRRSHLSREDRRVVEGKEKRVNSFKLKSRSLMVSPETSTGDNVRNSEKERGKPFDSGSVSFPERVPGYYSNVTSVPTRRGHVNEGRGTPCPSRTRLTPVSVSQLSSLPESMFRIVP